MRFMGSIIRCTASQPLSLAKAVVVNDSQTDMVGSCS